MKLPRAPRQTAASAVLEGRSRQLLPDLRPGECGFCLSEGSNTLQRLDICAFDEWLGQQFHRHDFRNPADGAHAAVSEQIAIRKSKEKEMPVRSSAFPLCIRQRQYAKGAEFVAWWSGLRLLRRGLRVRGERREKQKKE